MRIYECRSSVPRLGIMVTGSKKDYGIYPDGKYPGILTKLARDSKAVRDGIILSEPLKMELWHDLFHGKFIFVGKTVFGGEMLSGMIKDGSVGEKIILAKPYASVSSIVTNNALCLLSYMGVSYFVKWRG